MSEMSPDMAPLAVLDAPVDELPMPAAEQPPKLLPPPPPNAKRSVTRRGALAGAVTGAVVAAVVSFAVARSTDGTTSTKVVTESGSTVLTSTNPAGSSPSKLAGPALDIRSLIDKARPSVVAVETGAQQSSSVQNIGAGSGVIVSADGYVLTNNHVVDGGDVYKVKLTDGRTLDATLVGTAPADDLALLKVKDAKNLVPVTLGDSDALQVGDDVVAIGNALDLTGELSVTKGIVSAKNRSVPEPSGFTLEGTIQTDAAINPGNSGGAMYNASGELVGIPVAVSGQAQNIGFAIPVGRAKNLIEDLKKGGVENPNAGFLGVSAQPVSQLSDSDKQQYGVTVDSGLLVTTISKGSGADGAGLKVGDVVTKIDSTTIVSQGDLGLAIRSKKPGDKVSITFERSGSTKTAEAVLGAKPTGN
jgi:putative serine protease PepD